MLLPEPAGQPQHQLDSLKLVEPFPRGRVEQGLMWRCNSRRACRAELIDGHLLIFGQGAIAIQSQELIVFAHKHEHRDTISATDTQDGLQVRVGVPIEIANINLWRRLGKSLKDRTLIHAVAAPRSGNADDLHRANEAREQLALISN